ncbi:unnamed protein product [Phytomonas sp. Hart1]|nr:unnamed protein product [Phytomonas sp. Hart1]|eukprot:CCW71034.1 unnamed protein product [Phytomonas sp. isolate Hart1]
MFDFSGPNPGSACGLCCAGPCFDSCALNFHHITLPYLGLQLHRLGCLSGMGALGGGATPWTRSTIPRKSMPAQFLVEAIGCNPDW